MMRVGLALNITAEPHRDDVSVVRQHLDLGLRAEALGFDSVFVMEHHFSGFSLSPAPLALLAFLAGRTQVISLGTAVIVLPWHHPLEVAEQIVLIDILSGGRGIFGFGCGRAAAEFAGFGVVREEARTRFAESVKIIKSAVSGQRFSFTGQCYDIPELTLRPIAPPDMDSRFYGAGSSGEFAQTCHELGLGLMLSTQRPWKELTKSPSSARSDRKPIIFALVLVATSETEAQELASIYLERDLLLARRHFDPSFIDDSMPDDVVGRYCEQQIVGTPSSCVDQVRELIRLTGTDHIVFEVAFGGMPPPVIDANVRLLAQKVLPVIKALRVEA